MNTGESWVNYRIRTAHSQRDAKTTRTSRNDNTLARNDNTYARKDNTHTQRQQKRAKMTHTKTTHAKTNAKHKTTSTQKLTTKYTHENNEQQRKQKQNTHQTNTKRKWFHTKCFSIQKSPPPHNVATHTTWFLPRGFSNVGPQSETKRSRRGLNKKGFKKEISRCKFKV